MELHAPPEQIVNGIDKFENIFNRICFMYFYCDGLSGSIKLRKAYTIRESINISKHLLCLTTHLLSSKPPNIPP